MREQILSNLENPVQLERLYRKNRNDFKRSFGSIYPELQGNLLADSWHERLFYEAEEVYWGSRKEFLFVLFLSVVAGLFAKFPAIVGIDEAFFYPRNISFLLFPFLTAYFRWKCKLGLNKILVIGGIIAAGLVYINTLPDDSGSDTLILACIHLPFVLWVLFGLSFTGSYFRGFEKWLTFLRFNGELLVMCALLILAGILMTGITLALFHLIGLSIEEFYFRYVVIFGLPAVPLVAAFLVQTNPHLVNKVSPVIARLFSPLVLIMLTIYLGAIIYSGKDPYNDREFLLLFNVLQIGVMALIFFSITESSTNDSPASRVLVLLPLSVITIIVNVIALSAILFRISEWGFTPNRVTVLGANVLMLIHLLTITINLFQNYRSKRPLSEVGNSLVKFIPIYFIWSLLVVFLFPLLFNFN